MKFLHGVRRLYRRTKGSLKRGLQRATAPAHPYMGELLSYTRFLHEEGQDNVLLRHIGPPHQVEDLLGLLTEADGKERVDTIIVSDLHLGSKLSLAPAFSKALKRFSFNRLILNGDILDHLEHHPSLLKPAHRSTLEHLYMLSKTREVVWIEGNHDDGLSEFLRHARVEVRREYEWSYRGKRYLALHGDQFDTFYREHPLLYAIGAGFYMMVQVLGGPMSRRFCWFMKRKTKLYTHAITSSVRGALKHARERDADYVFCGHTHHVHEEAEDGVRYYNAGGWTESPCHLIAIGESGIRIHAFSEAGDYLGALSPLCLPARESVPIR